MTPVQTLAGPLVIPVFVVIPPRMLLIDLGGPVEVLRYANAAQKDIRFAYRYVAPKPQLDTSIGLQLTGLEPLPDTLPEGAYVLVPGSAGESLADPDVRRLRGEISAWLCAVVRPGITLVTICSGALLAAEAGLLDHHACTTHADCIADLRRLAPLARVEENRLFVEDGERLSSAGITTGTDLMLHLVSRLTSPATAVSVARTMVVYMRRSAADPQISPWLSGRNHIHPAIHRVQDAIIAMPSQDWSLERLAAIGHVSARHLSRLFREHTGMSVIDYINLMRVTLARDILGQSRLDMESVAERCGFASARHLRRVWGQHNAVPPSHYRSAGI
ncbi:GlxA family transcriptional regulator [Rhizobium halophytocola]|uniref:Transcriptional regulator GlxA family with amidase domain n=1 Tax=Rhizobium halophytocola TaxID=735519 RepID=A0ABS4DZZ2_9HYPH|nr:helix-turn-helix domain-containing protein [Rhizobium halophytocola]MBP1851253.1 transcriptional regulator GlxA family with amidase domain [Rhizobium halophytocola]